MQYIKQVVFTLLALLGAFISIAVGAAVGSGIAGTPVSEEVQVVSASLALFGYVFFILTFREKEEPVPVPSALQEEATLHDQMEHNQAQLQITNRLYRIQSIYSFAAALGAQGVALMAIIAAIVFFEQKEQSVQWITSVAALIAEFISGGFYVVYRNSLNEMNVIRKNLEETGRRLEGFAIIKDIPDESARVQLYRSYAESLLRLEPALEVHEDGSDSEEAPTEASGLEPQ